MSRSRTLAAIAAVTGLALLAGCNRQPPKFVPASTDSTAKAAPDSFGVRVTRALERWESQPGDAAAAMTGALIADDLGRHGDRPIAERARTVLDSCGFSGEVSGAGPVAAINLFARSDPSGGAWPSLFWRDGATVRVQPVDGSGMRLVDLAWRPAALDPAHAGADAGGQAALLFTRNGPRGPQPVVLVWRRPTGAAAWTLVQTLGPDSLGGTGSARFVGSPDGAQIEAHTFRGAPGFDECATCPHVMHTLRFAWATDGFAKRADVSVPSPYATFVALIAALKAGDHDLAARRLADPTLLESADRYQWGRGPGLWRVAPGTEEGANEMVFFHGAREAYRVRFSPRGTDWVVSDLQPVDRSIE
ncbi:MAG: hypothetical protein HY076_09265 [Candidatus Eisenbacteria bacterium]|uniref:Lipoprotein n=1 Tax=Eiseniibacteriota bacterium TaxID=2212470 RepID=A0A9D6L602_UNCEI|nr:hypothetical protein [Candidatus Eisenbacteria bacterium]MBI3540447.1 hypothetical protein [Candidatus Eisenbacteria bacterium]